MGDYKRLRVWQKAHGLTCAVYAIVRTFPKADQFVLGAQIRRAAISIGANIAEGCGRNGDGELRRLLNIALGSANELRHLLDLAIDVGPLPEPTARPLIGRLTRFAGCFRRWLTLPTKAGAPQRKGARPQPRPIQSSDS